jgi:hypothetical protein
LSDDKELPERYQRAQPGQAWRNAEKMLAHIRGSKRDVYCWGRSVPAAPHIEMDLLGGFIVPADTLYGIHTARARNFPLTGRPCAPARIDTLLRVKYFVDGSG